MFQKIPFLVTIFGMILGVMIAIVFGVNEDLFKNKIASDLKQNKSIQMIDDPAVKSKKIGAEKSKLWRYYQRFHFHSTGIGAMSLALLIFLSFVSASLKTKSIAAYLVSVGGFFYPFVWLFAAMFGGSMGRHEAKEAFAIFGYCGGLFMLGAIMILILAIRNPVKLTEDN